MKTNSYLEETIETKIKNQTKVVSEIRAALNAAESKLDKLTEIQSEVEVIQRRLNRA